ncbi:unnamed protein product [Toxocara canis]|uniref:G_PROTEIN_RECEP_F1_2 domain-containing protein n=1 Tax=Toxocara canis TaxID=6265 RepID=A0A183VAF9_TOXCA|nr:unnamed protein product [Toxocara canis]
MIPLANDDVYNLTAYYYNSEENLESNIVVAIIVLFGCVVYAVEIVLGIPANIFVLVKMVVFTRSTHDNMARSAAPGTCLLAMAIADIVSLTAILCHCLLNANLLQIDDTFHSLVCKLAIFSTHVATSISIWSWLLMSILRYISLYKPFWRYRAWYKPQRTLITIVILCSLLNIWLIPCVIYSSHQVRTFVVLLFCSRILAAFHSYLTDI